jgi:hypothetical protein
MWKAAIDLIALFLAWAGTMGITLVGVPALISPRLLLRSGMPIALRDGSALKGRSDPQAKAAHRRYLAWAVPGSIAITAAALLQALGSIAVLCPGLGLQAFLSPR